MDWKHLRCVALLLNRHRDRSFGADLAKREAASVGGLFHIIHRALKSAITSISVRSMLPVGPMLRRMCAFGERPSPPSGYFYLHVYLIEAQTNVLAFLEVYK